MTDEVALILRTPEQMAAAEGELASAAERAASLLKRPGMTMTIKGRDYIGKDGSSALAWMMGLSPISEEPVEIRDGNKIVGFKASCQLVDRAGSIRGRAYASCWMDEKTEKGRLKWTFATAYSMAQTRAMVKAVGMAIAPIVVISESGVSSTPAEEMVEAPSVTVVQEAKPDSSVPQKQLSVIDHLAEEAGWQTAQVARSQVLEILEAHPNTWPTPNGLRKALESSNSWYDAIAALVEGVDHAKAD